MKGVIISDYDAIVCDLDQSNKYAVGDRSFDQQDCTLV